jgi:hypothetical protein
MEARTSDISDAAKWSHGLRDSSLPPISLPKPPIITQMGGESPIFIFEYYTLKTLLKYYALKTLVKYVTLKTLVK